MKLLLLKELKDGMKNYRFIIMLAAFIFFAILNPVMTKFIMPQILREQMGDLSEEFISSMIDTSQRGIIRAYISDVYEVCILIFILVMSGIVSSEFRSRTLAVSRLSGKSSAQVVAAKFAVFSIFIFTAAVLANFINYFYASTLFGKGIDATAMLKSGTLQGLYFIFILSLVIFTGSFFTKPMMTSLASLPPAYGIPIVGKLLDIEEYLPSGLASESALLSISSPDWLFTNILITVSFIALFLVISTARLDDVEFTGRRK